MIITALTKILICSVFVISVNCDEGEYYWRPWTTGSPPPDAITLRDYRGVSYIVEAYVPNYGLYIAQIFANQHQVNVSVSNSSKTSVFVIQDSHFLKVLCTQHLDKLAWYPTNLNTLQTELVTATIKPVFGGLNADDQIVYIGKFVDTSRRNEIVGSVVKDNILHYHYGGKAFVQNMYEILIIGSKCST